MNTYLIGDVQGCFLTLKSLLATINFDKDRDRIIFLGDLINRGPRSLETLRFVKAHEKSMDMVLGNHEIFAISIALGAIKDPKPHTLEELFKAPDSPELIDWLRNKPLLLRLGSNILVHAGILPAVPINEAEKNAAELSLVIKSEKAPKFLKRYYKDTPKMLVDNLRPKAMLRLTLAYLTLIRLCKDAYTMDNYNGGLDKAPPGHHAWFALRADPEDLYFGHWAALGLSLHKNYQCLDSGCVWGEQLTALRLEDKRLFQAEYCD